MDIYKIVTDRLIELIESKQELIWQKSWNSATAQSPINFKSKTQYKGFNHFLLSACFESPNFLTFNQVSELGGTVIKGSRSTPIIYWNWTYLNSEGKKVKTEKEAVKAIPFLKYFNVFNESQIEGIEFPKLEVKELPQHEKIEMCETIVRNQTGLTLQHIDSSAYYMPSQDKINMPKMESFVNSESYYSVLFHEMAHWTGHKNRLNRFKEGEKVAAFGSVDYSKEELVAEMSSSFLCCHTQISNEQLTLNSAAYLKGWLRSLKNDTKMVVMAAAQAQKVFEYLTGIK